MDEVDAEIREEEEHGKLKIVVVRERFIAEGVVEFGVAENFHQEEGGGEDGDPRHGTDGLGDLHSDLIFEEFGVLKGGFVEDEEVG